jgi:alpha-amylase
MRKASQHPSVCFYFQVHQPYRLRDIRITELNRGETQYFDDEKNRTIFRKVAEKCYIPANRLMLRLLEQYPHFAISYSLSGIFLDQCEEYGQDILESFQRLADTGRVEFLAETYYHSLSCLKSLEEFCTQVSEHADKIETLFGKRPNVFRNTELIYSNEIAQIARKMGFKGILAEGADHVLHGRNPNTPFTTPNFTLPSEVQNIVKKTRPHKRMPPNITVLLKNYKLSDDVAFRFSDRSWIGFPLHADTFTDWLTASGGHTINLFMDYETFGEHQWEDTGIFRFLEALPAEWERRGIRAITPSEAIASWKKKDSQIYDVHNHISWADTERDLSAWQENHIQKSALEALFALEDMVKEKNDPEILKIWRRLQTSDHFYYMCTKYWSDGDVHKYFSPYDSPYEAYRRFSHAVYDLRQRLGIPS